MPRANDNRKPVGTGTCEKCGENTAEYFQVQKGKKMGYLYRKCLNCPANQSQRPADQFKFLEAMKRTPHPMIPHPLEGRVGEPEPEEPEPKPAPEPDEPQAPQGVQGTTSKTAPMLGVMGLTAAVLIGLFT